jgi:hypothetical protein
MDLRAFGSTYPYRGEVPYTSGFGIVPPAAGGTPVRFSTCRALFIESKANGTGGYLAVEFSDAPGQVVAAGNLKGDQLCPLSCTAIVSGDVAGVFVLY